MAPLLGPNMALSPGNRSGDTKLAARALQTTALGILLATVVALACGFLLSLDAESTEIASRTQRRADRPDSRPGCRNRGGPSLLQQAFRHRSSESWLPSHSCHRWWSARCCWLTDASTSLWARSSCCCATSFRSTCRRGTFLLQGVSPRSWWDAKTFQEDDQTGPVGMDHTARHRPSR